MSEITREEFKNNPWYTMQDFRARELNISLPSTAQDLYIYNINTKAEVKLRLIPDNISESYSPRISSVSPFGTLHPINTYTGGESKEVSFSFELHEDLNGIDGSLYKLLDIFKGMSLPYESDGRLTEPQVYLQLGNQFSGKGHITTSFEYKKPYRNGRYLAASCSLSFVFHEEFDSIQIDLSGDSIVGYTNPVRTVDFSSLAGGYASYEDFIKSNVDYDYIIAQIYADSKLATYFNIAVTADTAYQQDVAERSAFTADTTDVGVYFGGSAGSSYMSNPFSIRLFKCFYDFSQIIGPLLSIDTRLANLKMLESSLQTLKADYYNSFLRSILPNYIIPVGEVDDYGWYNPYITDNQTVPLLRQMSPAEKSAFEEAWRELYWKIITQKNIHAVAYGAGE